jgi:hypothetical protein
LGLGENVVENFVDKEGLTGAEVYVSPIFCLLNNKLPEYLSFYFNHLRRTGLDRPAKAAAGQSLCITAPVWCMTHLAAQQKPHAELEEWA